MIKFSIQIAVKKKIAVYQKRFQFPEKKNAATKKRILTFTKQKIAVFLKVFSLLKKQLFTEKDLLFTEKIAVY